MPPKPFKRIELDDKPKEASTTKADHTDSGHPLRYGERIEVVNVPYESQRHMRAINCTVNAAELQAGIRQQRKAFTEHQRRHVEYARVPKGKRTLNHKLPLEEEYTEDTAHEMTRLSTETTRTEH